MKAELINHIDEETSEKEALERIQACMDHYLKNYNPDKGLLLITVEKIERADRTGFATEINMTNVDLMQIAVAINEIVNSHPEITSLLLRLAEAERKNAGCPKGGLQS